MKVPVTGFSDALVLQSGTMLHFARGLKTIGELYYACRTEINQINALRDELWRRSSSQIDYEELTNPEIERLERSVALKMKRAMNLTAAIKKELNNARIRLDNAGFDDEIAPLVKQRSLQEHLTNLFREMTLDLSFKGQGVIAVSGFTTKTGKSTELLELLNEMAVVEIAKVDTLKLVERDQLDAVLEEQEFALSDLVDTSKAIEIGKLLTANYIVTGSVIEMSNSVVIFGRIINVETGEIESVAQVIVPKDRDVVRLL